MSECWEVWFWNVHDELRRFLRFDQELLFFYIFEWNICFLGRKAEQMIQITYISSSARPMDQNSLQDILVKSRKNNNEVGITGMLIYHNDTFLQVLEGDEEKVDTLMSKIKKDGTSARLSF